MSEFIFKLPDLGEGTVESEIGEWFIKVGQQVSEEDLVGTMMTDKAAIELSSPVSGTVVKLAGEPGDIVAVGAALVVFETDSDLITNVEEPALPTADVETAPAAAEIPGLTPRKRVMTSPAVRLRAKKAGIDLALITGSGPAGRITRSDFEQFAGAANGSSRLADRDRAHVLLPLEGRALQQRLLPVIESKEIKVIGLRRIIADRMATATREIPHFTYVEEIDITELEELRKHLNSKKVDKSERLTILPFLGLALMRALREFPQCNATYDKGRNVILQHGAVHLGVATQTSDGLKVPVVRNANSYSIDDLAAEIRRVTEAARNNSIKRDELSGSTITITSLGKLGGIASTPVINMPEVGIIGVNRAVERPVVLNGQVAVRLMMNLSSSFDHRFVDGYDGAAMIQRIKEMLEHPATIFL
jgi:2-oxoisovalerate dehydrogenase E2 component (dihydrolipoyl transacylase)